MSTDPEMLLRPHVEVLPEAQEGQQPVLLVDRLLESSQHLHRGLEFRIITSYSTIDFAVGSLGYTGWWVWPDSWYGLYRVLEWTPPGLMLVVAGVLIFKMAPHDRHDP